MNQENWYIVPQADGTCEIIQAKAKPPESHPGEFKTREEAIAKRIGLIRAGKCQPK